MIRTFVPGVCWVWLMLLPIGLAHAQEVLPVDYFTRSDEVGTVRLSPDGEYIAITTGQHGAEFLKFVNLEDPSVGAAVRAPEGLEIHEFYWASNTRVIFKIAERQPGRVQPTETGEIYAVDRDGRRQARIYGYRAGEMSTGTILRTRESSYAHPEVISLLDGDDRNVIITEMPWRESGNVYRYDPDARPSITLLDIYSGDKSRIGGVALSGATVIVDRDDVPRFALGTSDGLWSVQWKRTKDADAWETFELPGFREDTVDPLRFTEDNSAVLFTGVPDGQRYGALFQLTLADQSIQQLIDIPGADVRGVITDFEDRDIIGVEGYTDKLVYNWLLPDHPAVRLRQAVQRAFAGDELRFISHSANGKRAIFVVESDIAPAEYYLLDTSTKQADVISAARSWVDITKMRPKESIELEARDGTALHGYLTRPTGAGPYPLVVLPHGGPHGVRDAWGFDWEAQLFASRGYAVLQVNFRGSGGYGIDFQEAGYREWGAAMQDDVTDATKWLVDQKVASADRICIYGASYGGYAALMGAAREPKLYRCAIGYAGVYDLPLMFESGDVPDSELGINYLNRVLGTDVADLASRSPTSHANAIEAAVFLIHGTEDWRADYKHGIRMKEEIERAGMHVEWLSLRREGHGAYDDATRLEVYQAIVAFLDEHLKP